MLSVWCYKTRGYFYLLGVNNLHESVEQVISEVTQFPENQAILNIQIDPPIILLSCFLCENSCTSDLFNTIRIGFWTSNSELVAMIGSQGQYWNPVIIRYNMTLKRLRNVSHTSLQYRVFSQSRTGTDGRTVLAEWKSGTAHFSNMTKQEKSAKQQIIKT
jgi:hypothetical protein